MYDAFIFILFNKYILNKLYFLYSHFSSQPNKRVFHFFYFSTPPTNIQEGKLNLFYSFTFSFF